MIINIKDFPSISNGFRNELNEIRKICKSQIKKGIYCNKIYRKTTDTIVTFSYDKETKHGVIYMPTTTETNAVLIKINFIYDYNEVIVEGI